MAARNKVKAFLEVILPYTYGQKKRRKILELLDVCYQYDQWIATGGRQKAAKHAAKVKAQRAKDKKEAEGRLRRSSQDSSK